MEASNHTPKRTRRRLSIAVVVMLVAAVSIAGFTLRSTHHTSVVYDPIPKSKRITTSFPIYYPDNKRLPSGYRFAVQTFNETRQAADYAIDYDGSQAIAVTIQAKPSATALANFYSRNLPLRTTIVTPLGTATVGAIQLQTVISLPTNGSAWIIMTTAKPLTTDVETRILSSLTLAT